MQPFIYGDHLMKMENNLFKHYIKLEAKEANNRNQYRQGCNKIRAY